MMSVITAFVLGAFATYIGSWYLGFIEGNFALLLFIASVVTGVYWLAERFYFLPARLKNVQDLRDQAHSRDTQLRTLGITPQEADMSAHHEELARQPWWLDWTAGLFPVILVVFLLRSFLFEPFKIPSGSMIPTLLVGDLILVNKFHYGVRLPVINLKVTDGSPVERGDVMVFRFPPKPSLDYIKRVIGVPGDEVSYLNKELKINGVPVEKKALPEFFEEDSDTILFLKSLETRIDVNIIKINSDYTRNHEYSKLTLLLQYDYVAVTLMQKMMNKAVL